MTLGSTGYITLTDWKWLKSYDGEDEQVLELQWMLFVKMLCNPPERLVRHAQQVRLDATPKRKRSKSKPKRPRVRLMSTQNF